MANSIAYIKNFTNVLGCVYKKAAVSTCLDSPRRMVRAGAHAKEIKIPKIEVTGLGDYTRNVGYKTGAIEFAYETKTFNYDRGIRLMADVMDVEEAGVLDCFVAAGSELQRTQVAPEADAFTFATIARSKKSVRANFEDVGFEARFKEDDAEDDDSDWLEPQAFEESVKSGLTGQYIKEYAESLKSTARWWYATFYPDDEDSFSGEERKWIERLGRLGFVYFRPMVVAAFLVDDTTEAERVALLREIERFIFVAFRMSGAYATYNRNNVYRAARQVASGAITVTEATEELHQRIEDWIHPETSYDTSGFMNRIRRLFTNGDREGYYRWVGLRYLLYEYEDSLVEKIGNAQKKVDYFKVSERDKVSIEHIYPQTPDNEYWTERFGGYFEDEQRALTGSLGNLLLLSMSINAQLQNDSYPDKTNDKRDDEGELVRCGYSTGSHSENQVSNDYEDWNADAILDRGLNLLEYIEKRWNVKFPDEDAKRKMLFIDFV